MAGFDTQTYSAGVAAAPFVLPTLQDTYIMVKSHKANTGLLWVSERNDTAGVPVVATVNGDDCMIVEPGESVLFRRPGPQISVISTVAAQAFTVSNAKNRVR